MKKSKQPLTKAFNKEIYFSTKDNQIFLFGMVVIMLIHRSQQNTSWHYVLILEIQSDILTGNSNDLPKSEQR